MEPPNLIEPPLSPKKLRCVVVRPDVIVPGCICVPDEEGKRLAELRGEGGLGGYDAFGSKLDDFFGGSGGALRGDSWTSSRWQDIGDFVYGDGRDKFGGRESARGSELSAESIEGEGEGAGFGFEDFMRFYVVPCEHVLSAASSSEVSCVEPALQRSIVIVKPEAMVYKDAILRAIFEAGFQIVGKRVLHLTPEQVSEIYAKYYGSPSFPHLVIAVSSGPVLVMSIAALNVICKWKKMIGPDGAVREEWFFPISMRKKYGLMGRMPHALHGSENLKESDRENRYFYPDSILEPIITEQPKVTDYCELYVKSTLLNGLTEVVKKKPADPILFLADWLLLNNPYQPRMPYQIAVTPT